MTPARQNMGSRLQPEVQPLTLLFTIFISAPVIAKTWSILLGVLSKIFFSFGPFLVKSFPGAEGKKAAEDLSLTFFLLFFF